MVVQLFSEETSGITQDKLTTVFATGLGLNLNASLKLVKSMGACGWERRLLEKLSTMRGVGILRSYIDFFRELQFTGVKSGSPEKSETSKPLGTLQWPLFLICKMGMLSSGCED